MRSLIILEVEHGEDTDGIESMLKDLTQDKDWFGDGSLMITNHTIKIDLPECFVLDN